MEKLLKGIVDFRKNVLPNCREKFAMLAKGQSPDVLFIACSDSRVAPNWFASTDPGDLFVVRNVGNLVPPSGAKPNPDQIDESALAAVEFAIMQLHVPHIVVCGHSDCGAMNALLSGVTPENTPHLKSWLHYGSPALQTFNSGLIKPNIGFTPVNQLSQINVLQQIEHLKSYPFVRRNVEAGKLTIHGWWFDIAKADVYSYREGEKFGSGQFQIIE